VTSGSGGPGATCTGSCRGTCNADESRDSSQTCDPNTLLCCKTAGSGGPGGGTTTGGCGDPTKYEKIAGVCFPKSTSIGLSDKSVLQILTTLISWLLAIFGLIALLGFIISGLQYLTSAGDEGQAETAKRNMQYAIIGVIVALSGWIVIQAVDRLLNANSLI
jgi:hypothetical protein